jgi:hypothetical protein
MAVSPHVQENTRSAGQANSDEALCHHTSGRFCFRSITARTTRLGVQATIIPNRNHWKFRCWPILLQNYFRDSVPPI